MSLVKEIFDATQGRERLVRPAGPMLAVDVGSVTTRAVLIDVVEGRYRFVAHGQAPSTAGAPWNDVLYGVYEALGQIADATDRRLIDEEGDLIVPVRDGLQGVSAFVASASAGRPIRAILLGLTPETSLRSGRRAAESIYLSLLDSFALGDPRSSEERIGVLLNAGADLVIAVGGTDGGAAGVLRTHLDELLRAYALMNRPARPPVLYAGNRELIGELQVKADEVGFRLLAADNVRPTLHTEYLADAQQKLASLYSEKKAQNTAGIAEIIRWTERGVQPTAHGFGRMAQLLAGLYQGDVLAVDLGSMATTVAASLGGQQYLNVFAQLGIGHSASEVAGLIPPENIHRWLATVQVDADETLNYLWNKSLFPQTLPATPVELELEYAAAREIVRHAVSSARHSWRNAPARGLLPHFDAILLGGTTLTSTPNDGWSLLIALDALLPTGITRVLLDPHGLAPALGLMAPLNAQAVVQAIDAGAFYDLGYVISVSGRARSGEVVLTGTLKPVGGAATPFEAVYGSILALPLEYGQTAELTLEPRRGSIGEGGPRRKLTVTGGALGVVIDARGRPWHFPRDADERRERLREWQQSLAQEEVG